MFVILRLYPTLYTVEIYDAIMRYLHIIEWLLPQIGASHKTSLDKAKACHHLAHYAKNGVAGLRHTSTKMQQRPYWPRHTAITPL